MAVNKVQKSTGEVLIDLTADTVTPDTLLKGETAHGADGVKFTGTMEAAAELVPVEVQFAENVTEKWLQFDFRAVDTDNSNKKNVPARSMCVISASTTGAVKEGDTILKSSVGVTVPNGMTYRNLEKTYSSTPFTRANLVVAVDVGTSGGIILLKKVLGAG